MSAKTAHNVQRLQHLEVNLVTPSHSSPESLAPCLLNGGHGGWTKEILKVLLPLLHDMPSLGKQFLTHTKHNMGRTLLSLSEHAAALLAIQIQVSSFCSLTASLTPRVHQRVLQLPAQ